MNLEFSYNGVHWDPKRFTSEIRPIVGWHLGSVDLVFNPILDTSWDGLGALEFAPSTRVAWRFSPVVAVAVEEYDDFGPLDGFPSVKDQGHELFGVVDLAAHAVDIALGAGVGLTEGTDDFTLKLIPSRDLD